MSDVEVGQAAPEFDLESDSGRVSSAALRGKIIVLYFYPKDDTSGCTREAIEFSALNDQFEANDAVVIGVSKDSVAKHAKFREKYDLTVRLASDPEGKTVERYGSWVEKNMYGRKYMGIDRSTFLIDRNGVVRSIWRKVKVPGHAEAVLNEVKTLA